MFVLTGVYVIATIMLVYVSYKQLRTIRDIEQEKSRPYVTVELKLVDRNLFFNITNIGATAAKNVKIISTPKIVGVWRNDKEPVLLHIVENGILYFPPQRNLCGLLGSWEEVYEFYGKSSFSGVVQYESNFGKVYEEAFDINADDYEGLASIEKKGPLDKIVEELKKISKK